MSPRGIRRGRLTHRPTLWGGGHGKNIAPSPPCMFWGATGPSAGEPQTLRHPKIHHMRQGLGPSAPHLRKRGYGAVSALCPPQKGSPCSHGALGLPGGPSCPHNTHTEVNECALSHKEGERVLLDTHMHLGTWGLGGKGPLCLADNGVRRPSLRHPAAPGILPSWTHTVPWKLSIPHHRLEKGGTGSP